MTARTVRLVILARTLFAVDAELRRMVLRAESHPSERHRRGYHGRRSEHRYALSHLLTTFPFSPKRNPPTSLRGEVAGCATGSARLSLKRPSKRARAS